MPVYAQTESKLISRDFLLLFLLALFSNCYLSVYYCFEQWLDKVAVSPNWRGILLGALFGVVMLTRPFASVLLLRCNKLPIVFFSLLSASGIMLSYQFLSPTSPFFVWTLLLLRIAQGFLLALFSSIITSVLVSCIPLGQSARGFAIFSFTLLLPYALIPGIGEMLLPILGNEPALYAATSLLSIPAFLMIFFLAPRLRRPEIQKQGVPLSQILHKVTHSGLSLVFLATLCFGLTTATAIFFIKGLCSLTGGNPALFFFFYTTTVITFRCFANTILDKLPRYLFIPFCSLLMALSLVLIAWQALWLYIPATLLYGACLSFIYPLIAAMICDRSAPDARSINSNLMLMMFDASSFFSPIIGGIIMDFGFSYRAIFTAAAICISLCALFTVLDGIRTNK